MYASPHRRPHGAVAALLALALLGAPALAVPSPQSSPPPSQLISPTVDNMTETGSGCPIGSGGMIHEMRNNTPVFLYTDWGLTLNSNSDSNATQMSDAPSTSTNGTVAKFCKEMISLGNAPEGYQLRIASVSVGGWAKLDEGTLVGVRVNTRFDGVEAGRANATVTPSDLKGNNTFEVTLTTAPETWSACVNSTGKVPTVVIRTSVSLNGTERADGTYSGGVLGGSKMDMKKGLTIHFIPEWRECPASQ